MLFRYSQYLTNTTHNKNEKDLINRNYQVRKYATDVFKILKKWNIKHKIFRNGNIKSNY